MFKRGDPMAEDVVPAKDDVPVPTLKAFQVLVKVAASSMNPVDWNQIDGSFPVLPVKGVLGVYGRFMAFLREPKQT